MKTVKITADMIISEIRTCEREGRAIVPAYTGHDADQPWEGARSLFITFDAAGSAVFGRAYLADNPIGDQENDH